MFCARQKYMHMQGQRESQEDRIEVAFGFPWAWPARCPWQPRASSLFGRSGGPRHCPLGVRVLGFRVLGSRVLGL